eukprot:29810-Rhodomonas_salina.1
MEEVDGDVECDFVSGFAAAESGEGSDIDGVVGVGGWQYKNKIGDAGATAVAESLPNLKQLTQLHLDEGLGYDCHSVCCWLVGVVVRGQDELECEGRGEGCRGRDEEWRERLVVPKGRGVG